MDLTDDRYCFACGPENPIGLNMKLNYKQNKVTVEFIPKKEHQGWHNMVHGGILFTLMDEAMAKLIIEQGDMVVTSR
ncbi:MAG: PaaI family thioesterase, partial [Vulcanimicrobiota bacterium]